MKWVLDQGTSATEVTQIKNLQKSMSRSHKFDFAMISSTHVCTYIWDSLNKLVFQALAASKSSRQETAALKAENHTLTITICEKEENLSSLRDQFRDEVSNYQIANYVLLIFILLQNTQLRMSQEKVAQLESAFFEEQESKVSSRDEV